MGMEKRGPTAVLEPGHGLCFWDPALIKMSQELAIVVINEIVLQLIIKLTLQSQHFFR